MLNEEEQGLGIDAPGVDFDWLSEWWKPTTRFDKRLQPAVEGKPRIGAGRRMTHPYFDPIVYPRIPNQTFGFDHDVIIQPDAVLTKTLQGTAVTDFIGDIDDTIIREVWLAQSLSTMTAFFRELQRYRTTILPAGQYIGWEPRDRTHKRYAIQLLKVECGEADEYLIEELGGRPYLMRQALTIRFKTIREVRSASSLIVGTGA